MTLKYESELLFDLMKRDGDDAPSGVLPYESELKEKYLKQVEGAYPKLMDYRPEWLNYNLYGYLPAEFPVETLSNVTNATVHNVVPYAYGSASLNGSTKYHDIDTGEILETFKEGRKLELVSVKMAGLTTTGKNLVDDTPLKTADLSKVSITKLTPIKVEANKSYYVGLTLQGGKDASTQYFTCEYKDENGNVVAGKYHNHVNSFTEEEAQKIKTINIFTNKQHGYSSVFVEHLWVVESSEAVPYEPYQSNILTSPKDIELRGIGDVQDTLDVKTGTVTKKIDFLELSPNMDWVTQREQHQSCYSFYINTPLTSSVSPVMCNQFSNLTTLGSGEGLMISGSGRLNINILKTKLNDGSLESLKTWLKSNPTQICYVVQETVKTVELTVTDQNGKTESNIRPFEGTMHIMTNGTPIKPTATIEVPVEAITQNLMSFANILEEE